MKKLLLSILFISSLGANAQFWTSKATTFTTTSRGVSSISIVDDNTVWVKAYDGSGAGVQTIKEYAKSTDGGNTWTSGTMVLGAGTAGLGISSITAVSSTTAWVSAFPATGNLGGVWKTTNGGTTWTKQASASFNNSSESFTNFVYFWDANNGICQGDPENGYFEIYTTTNGGTTWTRVPSSSIPAPSPAGNEYGYSNNYAVSGNTIWFGTSSGRLFKSTDKGLTWTVSQSPVSDFGSATAGGSYSFSDTSKGILSTTGGALYNTTDGGATWNPLSFSGPIFLADIQYVPGTTRVVTTGSGSSYSLDDGVTWTGIDTTQRTTCAFLNTSTGFAGGFTTSATSDGIYKYTGTELKTESFNASKFTTYPNPANDVITISSSENINFNTIDITDINGRIVKTFKTDNVSEIQINVSDLNSGVYFMDINSDNGKAVKKFIKN